MGESREAVAKPRLGLDLDQDTSLGKKKLGSKKMKSKSVLPGSMFPNGTIAAE